MLRDHGAIIKREIVAQLGCLFRVLLITLIIIVAFLYIVNIKLRHHVGFYMSKSSIIVKSENDQVRCVVHFKNCSGRLGNQMFMVASTYGLARLHSCRMYLTPKTVDLMKSVFIFDLSPFLISTAMFDAVTQDSSKPMTRIIKEVGCQYIYELTRPNAIASGHLFELKGYWQSYLHFTKYSDDIRKYVFAAKQSILEKVAKLFIKIYKSKFDFKPEFSLENYQILKKQLTGLNKTTWVGIHVRRSDFVSLKFSSPDAYLFSAIEYYLKIYPNAYFIVTSDDKTYCKKLFRNQDNVFITPNTFNMGDDLITLSLCEHSIISGGTYGWWTGYLANGLVVHDKTYRSGCERPEYYYPPWFLIDGNIRAYQNSNYTL